MKKEVIFKSQTNITINNNDIFPAEIQWFFNRALHQSSEGGFLFPLSDSSSLSFELMDFLKFFMPSPKDFPNSGSLRAPKIITMIKTINKSSIGPTGPNKNIKTSKCSLSKLLDSRLKVKLSLCCLYLNILLY